MSAMHNVESTCCNTLLQLFHSDLFLGKFIFNHYGKAIQLTCTLEGGLMIIKEQLLDVNEEDFQKFFEAE